jgi:hypothetical protein
MKGRPSHRTGTGLPARLLSMANSVPSPCRARPARAQVPPPSRARPARAQVPPPSRARPRRNAPTSGGDGGGGPRGLTREASGEIHLSERPKRRASRSSARLYCPGGGHSARVMANHSRTSRLRDGRALAVPRRARRAQGGGLAMIWNVGGSRGLVCRRCGMQPALIAAGS